MNAYRLGKIAAEIDRTPQSQHGKINVIVSDPDVMYRGIKPGFDPLTFGEKSPHAIPGDDKSAKD